MLTTFFGHERTHPNWLVGWLVSYLGFITYQSLQPTQHQILFICIYIQPKISKRILSS